jgi:hypothetical protein
MSKKYKGKTCVYCASNPSTTRDHVFAREFFAKERRANLPQVPACQTCNAAKSALEHYLTTILLIGGRHPDAEPMMFETLARRLQKNAKLHREIVGGMRLTVIEEPPPRQGLIPIQVPFNGQRLLELLTYVARGLLSHHFGVTLPPDIAVCTISLTRTGEALIASLSEKYGRRRVSADLGRGTFVYEGAQCEYPEHTLWKFSVFGGIRMHGESATDSSASTTLAAITGREETLAIPDFAKILYRPLVAGPIR